MKEDQMNSSPEENRDEATSQEGEEKEEKSGFTLPLSPKITASLVIGALLISFSIGYFLSPRGEDGRDQMSKKKGQGDKGNIKYWSCSMHPQIKMPKAGKCPICQMDLIPVREGGGSSEDREGPVLKLGPRARKLAEIETAPALYRRVTHKVDLIGKIAYDETLISYITTRFPGRIERLYVDFTGTLIRKGDHIAEIYSPEFRATQEELISDQKAYEEAKKTGNKLNIRMAKTKLEASKKKLKLWDLTKSQIKKILQSKSPTDEITIYATQGGTVLHKNATVGLYVKEGDKLYTTVDLKRVWLIMDAYETDLPWLKFGQEVTFQVKTYPGRTFKGRIAFIDPVLNEKTRTVKIRVNVPNPERLLKPGMLVRAQVHSQVGAEGTVINPDLASQWVCPMHPYEVSSKPGQICSRCQMDMVPAKSLGILKPSSARSRVLTIPHTAPLITGQRTVVYVRTDSDKVQHRYEGREIKLGPRAGDYYVVYEGLHEGEEVVTRGNFKIDSALQIVAKPSLMSHQPLSPPKKRQATPPFGLGRGKYHKLVEPIFSAYFKLEELLTYEKGKEAGEVAKKLITLLQEFDSSGAQSLSKGGQKKLAHLVDQIKKDFTKDLKISEKSSLRVALRRITPHLEKYLKLFGHRLEGKIYRAHCPMAFDREGAYWLQDQEKILNPYEGENMPHCGSIKASYLPLEKAEVGKLAQVREIDSPYFKLSFHKALEKIIASYLVIHSSLTQDKFPPRKEVKAILDTLHSLKPEKLFPQGEREQAQEYLGHMHLATRDLRGKNLPRLRRDFLDLSENLIQFIRRYGHSYPRPLYLFFCPGYRQKLGGHWLQSTDKINNPYMSDMPKCGQLKDTFAPHSVKEKMKEKFHVK